LISLSLEQNPTIENFYADHVGWVGVARSLRIVLMADPPHRIGQMSLRFCSKLLPLLYRLPPMLHLKRLHISTNPTSPLSSLLQVIAAGTFPRLERLDIVLDGHNYENEFYCLGEMGSSLENLIAALQGCGKNLRILSISPPEILRQACELMTRNTYHIDDWEALIQSKLNLKLSGLHGIFPAIASLSSPDDLDEISRRCYKTQLELSYGDWMHESHRMLCDIGDLVEMYLLRPGMHNMPQQWILACAIKLVSIGHVPDPDAYNPPGNPIVSKILVPIIQPRTWRDLPDGNLQKLFEKAIEADSRNFDALVSSLSWQIASLFRETNLVWRRMHVDINHLVNEEPLFCHFYSDIGSLVEILKHPELDLTIRGPENETLLDVLFLRCRDLISTVSETNSHLLKALRMFLTHPGLDNPLVVVEFPQTSAAIDALFSNASLLRLFCRKCTSHLTIISDEVISLCIRSTRWLKTFREVFLALKAEQLCADFVSNYWRRLLTEESNETTLIENATELRRVFDEQTPKFVRDIAHGSKSDSDLETVLAFEHLKKILQKLIPAAEK
jgi:hypothetical protein